MELYNGKQVAPMKDYMPTTLALIAALRQLENTTSTGEKRTLIAKYLKEIPEFKDMLLFALDPYKMFGIKRFPIAAMNRSDTGTWFDINYFLTHMLTGEKLGSKEEYRWLQLMVEGMSGPVRDLFKRVLLKDLRCGVGATLVNSVVPGLIPSFGCQLAEPLEARHIAKLQTFERVYGQPKLNGDRAIAICAPGEPALMVSRKGHQLNNYTHVAEALTRVQEKVAPKRGIVFDGEIIYGDFFQTRSVKKLPGNEAHGAIFHCFDAIQLPQWRRGETDTFSVRAAMLLQIARLEQWEDAPNLTRVQTGRITDITMEKLDGLRDAFIKGGHEGLMIRPDLPYNFNTRSSIYKHKKMDTVDCLILEVLPGEEGKKDAHHAARLLVELPNGNKCKAGLRLSNAARDVLWAKRAQYVGLVAEISFQEATKNAEGKPKLQFPVFTGRIRKDKS